MFEMRPTPNWPNLKGHGLPDRGIPILHASRVSVDQSKWWLSLCGLATLAVTHEHGQKLQVAHVFVGRIVAVEELQIEVLKRTRQAFDQFGHRLAMLTTAFEQDQQALFLSSRYVRHHQIGQLLAAHDILCSDSTKPLSISGSVIGYSWTKFNCEHFVRYAHAVPIESPQLKRFTFLSGAIGVFALMTTRPR